MAASISSGITVSPNVGPLTSLWTPSASCLNTNTWWSSDGFAGPGMRGTVAAANCYPERWASNTVYSPGVCPSGWQYRTAPTTASGWSTSWESGLNVKQCCPGTMTPWSGSPYWCAGSLPANTLYTFWSSGAAISNGAWLTTSWSTEGAVYARPIHIAYRASNTEIFTVLPAQERPTAASTASPGSSPTTTPSATSTSTNLNTNNNDNNTDGGLSTGAKIGIGVGVAMGAILIALIAGFWLWSVRRHKKRDAAAAMYEPHRNSQPMLDQYHSGPGGAPMGVGGGHMTPNSYATGAVPHGQGGYPSPGAEPYQLDTPGQGFEQHYAPGLAGKYGHQQSELHELADPGLASPQQTTVQPVPQQHNGGLS